MSKKFHETKIGNVVAAVVGIGIAAFIVFALIGK
jgi:hypothetical protein